MKSEASTLEFDILVENEFEKTDWSRVMDAHGLAADLPDAIRLLLLSCTPEDAKRAYWGLENRVFVQGSLFEAALPTVGVILAALVDLKRPAGIRGLLLEVLYHIVNGTPHQEEVARGLAQLADQCRAAAREGLWLLYQIFQEGEFARAAAEIIERIDLDPSRLPRLRLANSQHGRSVEPEKWSIPPGKDWLP